MGRPAILPEIGKKYGRWLVLGPAPNMRRQSAVRCRCECGTEKTIVSSCLRAGKTHECEDCGKVETAVVGQKYGQWLVLKEIPHTKPKEMLCRCECGLEKPVRDGRLRKGESLGCDPCEKKRRQEGAKNRTYLPEYSIWCSMCGRCYYTGDSNYVKYGARGIVVADRWRGPGGFDRFIADVGRRPSPEHSIERKDNNGNYEPDNVRWATRIEQGQNKRNNVFLEFGGKRQCVAAWAREVGIPVSILRQRIKLNWPIEKILTMSPGAASKYDRIIEFKGHRRRLVDWAREIGIPVSTLSSRFSYGWSTERALTEPSRTYS